MKKEAQRDKGTKAQRFQGFIVALFCAWTLSLVFSGCGGSGSGGTTLVNSATGVSDGATGQLAVQLLWDTPGGKFSAPSGVSTVRISISASDMPSVTRDFTASANAGTLTAILAGTSRVVSAKGLDSAGGCLYSGATSGVTVTAGQVTAVTVTMSTSCNSVDGFQWAKYTGNPVIPIINANVQVLLEGNTYRAWFESVSLGGLGYATSADGKNWSSISVVFHRSDGKATTDPSIIKDGSVYKMWYAANNVGANVGYAESTDGITWTDFGVVLDVGASYDSVAIRFQKVIKDGSVYKMWYAGTASTWNYDICYATSPDGKVWTKQGVVLSRSSLNASTLNVMEVIKDSSGYRLWFGKEGTPSHAILYATSADGVNWNVQGTVLSLSGSENALGGRGTIILGNPNKMWYGCGIGDWAVCYAESTAVNTTAGNKIVFTSNRDGNREIYSMNSDGTGVTRLTNDSIQDLDPDLSPDGTKIIWARGENGAGQVYQMNSDGTGAVNLTNSASNDYYPKFSMDMSKITFTRNGSVYTMNANGSNVSGPLSGGISSKFSPDGTKIVFTCDCLDGGIYVMNADGTYKQLIGSGNDPVFSPDGGKILYNVGNNEIYIMDADSTNAVNLSNNSAVDAGEEFSPDGTKIVFQSNRDGNNEIYIMNVDGTNQTRLTNNAAEDIVPSF